MEATNLEAIGDLIETNLVSLGFTRNEESLVVSRLPARSCGSITGRFGKPWTLQWWP